MASSLGALVIDLLARTGKFETDTGRAARIAEKRSREIERSFSRMGSRITRVFAGLAAGFSFAAIVRATSEAEKAFAQLGAAVKSTGGVAGFTAPQLASMASQLQGLTTYGDEAIQTMQAILLTFTKIRGPEFREAQEAILNVATRLGVDLKGAALQVGKALNDPILGVTALARAGIQFDDSQKKLIKSLVDTGRISEAQRIILNELEVQFGGSARAARDTFGGALEGLKNAFGDLLEAKTGMPGAVSALNELSALLQDPATAAAADTLTSGLVRGFSGLAGVIAQIAGGVKVLAENFAASRFGPAADDLVRLDDQLQEIERRLKSTNQLGQSIKPFALFDRFTGNNSDRKKELEAQRELLLLQIEAARAASQQSLAGAASVGGAGQGSAPASEEFLKLQSRLKEQIALYGKTGEAAKISFQIQSGALDELSTAEQSRVLALARQYDAIVKNTAASKELESTRKKSAEEIAKLSASLAQEIALYGKGALATIEYRIAHGDLAEAFKALGPEAENLKQKIIDATIELDGMSARAELAEKRLEAFRQTMAEGAAVVEATRTPLEKFNAEIERLNKLRDAGALGANSAETYRRAVEAAQDALDKASKDGDAFGEQFKDGVFRSLSDGIYTAMTDGAKRGWKGFLDAGIETINRLVAQALAKRLAEGLFGDGKSGGGWLGSLGKVLGGIFGGGRADGGPVTAGTLYRINEREPEFFRPNTGGQVVPLSKMPSSGGVRVTQNITIPGRPDMRTAQQLSIESARRLRIQTARLG